MRRQQALHGQARPGSGTGELHGDGYNQAECMNQIQCGFHYFTHIICRRQLEPD